MNIEPDIFDYLETTSLEPHDDYTSEFTYAEQKQIWHRIKEQKQQIDQLTNNWNELEKWVESHLDDGFCWFKFYDKMQTIKGDNK